MPNTQLIFLIGMPAAGKTYWGEKIAHEYGLRFVDMDAFIAQHERASVPAIFASYGEAGFREREHKYLAELTSTINTSTVIASGGGTPCFYDNMALMKNAGVVIYLQADIATLQSNIKLSDEIRPMLRGRKDVAAYLGDMLEERKKYYEQAHYILQAKDISLATFAEIITSCINRH